MLADRAGRELPVRGSAGSGAGDQRGQVAGVVIALGDLSEARQLSARMVYQATHDALTDVPNLNLLRDRLKQAIARARRTHQNLALLFVGLDHFKKINEGLGHTAGDALARAAATRSAGLRAQGRHHRPGGWVTSSSAC